MRMFIGALAVSVMLTLAYTIEVEHRRATPTPTPTPTETPTPLPTPEYESAFAESYWQDVFWTWFDADGLLDRGLIRRYEERLRVLMDALAEMPTETECEQLFVLQAADAVEVILGGHLTADTRLDLKEIMYGARECGVLDHYH